MSASSSTPPPAGPPSPPASPLPPPPSRPPAPPAAEAAEAAAGANVADVTTGAEVNAGAEGADVDPDAEPGADVLRAILRQAPPPPPPRIDVLRGVQERLRVRSRGKFYADGWSTRDEEPRATYLVTALFMLVVAVALYLALSPGAAGGLP